MKKLLVSGLLLSLLLTLAACSPRPESGTTEIAGEGELEELSELDIITEPDIALLDGLSGESSTPPAFQAEYTDGELVGCVTLDIYTYSWTYDDETGEVNNEVNGVHPLDDPEIVTCNVAEGTEMTFLHSEKVNMYMVYMWREGADVDDCRVIAIENDRLTVEKDAIYMVSAVYENGSIVDYAFKTL